VAQFTVNVTRFDPYKTFQFRVKMDGVYVAGLSKMSALKRSTTPVLHRNGGDPSVQRVSPGLTKHDAITLERGVTHDRAFADWANLVHNLSSPMSLRNFRKDLVVDLFNEADQKVLSYKVYRCWVSEYQALPPLDADNAAIAIETIKIENEGFEQDPDVPEPAET
jgi:phage tail-like protein